MKRKPSRKKYYRNDQFLIDIGSRVREYRLAKGMTQTELAFECEEADYSQINRIELGKANFSVSYLALLAEVLDVSPKDLIP